MKQLEIDSEIHQWFSARQRVLEARRELSSAECTLSNAVVSVTKRLLPSDAKPGEIYIFPSTEGRAVRCFLKPVPQITRDGIHTHAMEPVIEEHDFNRK